MLQHLMVLQHQNVTHTSMITVKCKKLSPIMMFLCWLWHIHSLQKNRLLGSLLFCSIILKSMLRNVLLLMTWPTWVHRHFQVAAEDLFKPTYINLSRWYWEYLFNAMWQKFCQIEYRKTSKIREGELR